MKKMTVLAAGWLALGASGGWAQATETAKPPAPPASAPAGVQFAKPPSDADNYTGDRISYDVTVKAQGLTLGAEKPLRDICLPRGMSLRGIGKTTLVDNGKSLQRSLFQVRREPEQPDEACKGDNRVKLGETVLLDPEMLRQAPPDRYGWTFGTLVVPYKYQFRGDRSLSGGATLGGYAGYRVTAYGTSGVIAAFGGATKVDVPTLKDGKSVTESVAGLSYGVGVLASIKDAFKLGLVVGADRVDKKLGYVNNGKAWVSFSLGYDFFQ